MQEIVTLISNVGFPIVMSLVLIKQLRDTQKEHEEESKGFIQSIDNNTKVLSLIMEKLDIDKEV